MALLRRTVGRRLNLANVLGIAHARRSAGASPEPLQVEDLLDEEHWTDGPKPLSESEKRALVKEMIRSNILSEVAAAQLAAAQRFSQKDRPDLAMRQEREEALLRRAEALAGPHRARPSLLRPAVSALGWSLGAAASVLPRQASGAILGAVQEALTEQHNGQLRRLREAGMSDSEQALRDAVKEFRDEERAPIDAVQAPDILKLQRPQELSAPEVLAAAVKYSLQGLLGAGAKL